MEAFFSIEGTTWESPAAIRASQVRSCGQDNGRFWSYSKRRRCAGRIEGSEGYRISTPLPVA